MYDIDQYVQHQIQERFGPVVHLPVDYEVLDLSRGSNFESSLPSEEAATQPSQWDSCWLMLYRLPSGGWAGFLYFSILVLSLPKEKDANKIQAFRIWEIRGSRI